MKNMDTSHKTATREDVCGVLRDWLDNNRNWSVDNLADAILPLTVPRGPEIDWSRINDHFDSVILMPHSSVHNDDTFIGQWWRPGKEPMTREQKLAKLAELSDEALDRALEEGK